MVGGLGPEGEKVGTREGGKVEFCKRRSHDFLASIQEVL